MKKLVILLSDDSRFFRTIEAKFLQKMPAELIESDSCESTMELLRTAQPDLIYMASSLQPEGGAACCRMIKNDPDFKQIPVVMICDPKETPATSDELRECGCDDFLVKPLERLQFLQVGRKFLPGVRDHRQPSFFQVFFKGAGEEFRGKCLDISGGGMFIETKEEVSTETILTLRFRLPDKASTEVVCQGKVMWVNHKPNLLNPNYPHGLGVMFTELAPDYHEAIILLTRNG